MRPHDCLWIRPSIQIPGWHVALVELHVIQVHRAVPNADLVSRHSDHALDVALGRIPWVAEDDNVAALDGFKVIDEFVDEDALLVFETRKHAGALNFYRLVQKDND